MTDARIQTIDDKILLHKELSGSLKYEIRNTNPLTHSTSSGQALVRTSLEFGFFSPEAKKAAPGPLL